MSVLAELEQLSSAEDFFDYLGVSYDPQVLSVARLHIMRLLGDMMRAEVQAVDSGEEDHALRARLAGHLGQAYSELRSEGPLSKRLFKVHKEAVTEEMPSSKDAFVPLSELNILPEAWSPKVKRTPMPMRLVAS